MRQVQASVGNVNKRQSPRGRRVGADVVIIGGGALVATQKQRSIMYSILMRYTTLPSKDLELPVGSCAKCKQNLSSLKLT